MFRVRDLWRLSLRTKSTTLAERITNLHVWASHPVELRRSDKPPPWIILFGFAGSKPRQLDKQAAVYNELGYNSLSTILPHQHLFYYNTAEVRNCADLVVEEILKHQIKDIVIHSLSNNGAALYQHLTQTAAVRSGKIAVKGAVFDSAPGPANFRDYFPELQSTSGSLSRTFLLFSFPAINYINGMKLSEIIASSVDQLKNFPSNWSKNRHVPWPGPYMMNEKQEWPLLFIYSKKDTQIPWSFIHGVSEAQRLRGRMVVTKMFTSGHVAHLKNNPKEYSEALKDFLESIEKER